MPLFTDQFAIVTGAGGGIGRAISRALADQGATVWAVGRTPGTLSETVADCGSAGTAYPADLTEDAEVDRLVEAAGKKFGRVDILVHSAGTIGHGAVADSPVEGLDAQYRSNVRLPYRVTQAMLPLLRKTPGQIVFVNSSIVSGGARSNVSQFASTQHAVRAFADTLRQEVNGDGIRVLCVYPGRTATSRQARLYAKEGKAYQVRSSCCSRRTSRRWSSTALAAAGHGGSDRHQHSADAEVLLSAIVIRDAAPCHLHRPDAEPDDVSSRGTGLRSGAGLSEPGYPDVGQRFQRRALRIRSPDR